MTASGKWYDSNEFQYSELEVDTRDLARKFASELAPLAPKIDAEGAIPHSMIKKMGELGFLGATVSEADGGLGLSDTAFSLIIEEIASVCASTAILCSAHHSLGLWPVAKYGTAAAKERYLPGLLSGDKIGAFALTEPNVGSDAGNLSLSLKRDGDKIVLNGTKAWITNAPIAEVFVVFATEEVGNRKKISAFVHGADGLIVNADERKLGICGSRTASITYYNFELNAKECLLGDFGDGFKIALDTLNSGRIGVASQALGIVRGALDLAINYCDERKSFGKRLNEHDLVRTYLAEMILSYESAKQLTLLSSRKKEAGLPFVKEASCAKLAASRAANFVSGKSLQLFGGNGFSKEYSIERYVRDAKITEIYEGTTEMQLFRIAREVLRK